MLSDTKQTVRRNEEGWKMYPGRFWEWPTDLPPIDTYEGRMEYGIALWTNTNEVMPTIAQIRYALVLLRQRAGADPDLIDWSSKKSLGKAIYEMVKLPVRKGAWARPGREV